MAQRYFEYFPPSQPRKARGGIKAQSKRGDFGNSWWARRWIEVLESFDIGARLSRGRSYARRGQVVSIDIEKGEVNALVQGSRPRPYKVKIVVKTLTEGDWKRVAEALSSQAVFAARLLAGDMPENVEEAFTSSGCSAFPRRLDDLETDCSCPDWSNPCKHIAAVYYLLGEEFNRDPFLIFKLRGIERDDLMQMISVGGPAAQTLVGNELEVVDAKVDALPAEPLPIEPEAFWGGAQGVIETSWEADIPSISAALPRRLGGFPFWRGEEDLIPRLEDIYRKASNAGLRAFLGETSA